MKFSRLVQSSVDLKVGDKILSYDGYTEDINIVTDIIPTLPFYSPSGILISTGSKEVHLRNEEDNSTSVIDINDIRDRGALGIGYSLV